MSTDYILETPGHPNIYNESSPRSYNTYFAIPDNINDDTGLLLLIPGFGANANSKVYLKMRKEFSDKYNLVVVQCDYFGWEFMQTSQKTESLDNYNDMGIMQALDNISSLLIVKEILKDNGYHINENRIITYGHSHGCYLSYLCNAFAPNLFNLIVDNSAWIFPAYLNDNRYLNRFNSKQNKIVKVIFDYLAKKIDFDRELLNLNYLYRKIESNANVVIFQGENDFLIESEEKRQFSLLLKNSSFYLIKEEDLDGDIFKSTDHGLGADFLKLFDLVMSKHIFEDKKCKPLASFTIETKSYNYLFNYETNIPVLSRTKI